MKLKTFAKGGVHPKENKLSAAGEIRTISLPKTVSIPISQHLGAPSKVIVKKGDEVKVGTLIAESAGFISANIHSSVSGKVLKVEEVMDTSGYRKEAVTITVEGDEWDENIDQSIDIKKDINLSAEEIVEKVQKAGIVGLGGATFPSNVKLTPPPGKTAEVIVINGVECEPYLTSDHRLMLEHAEEIVIGTTIAMKALNVKKAIIGIENNKPNAIEHLKNIVSNYNGIEVSALKVLYPQGGEKQLIKSVLNREVPSGALPIEVGAVVFNVGTCFAMYHAVQKNRPLIDRVVTVTGKSLPRPTNYLARIGTPVSLLIESAGGLPQDTGKIINGGPMMGKALSTPDVPVTKGTSGIVLVRNEESCRNPEKRCIRCAKCVSVCPMGLEPYLLSAISRKSIFEKLEKENIMDCIECGSCSYTCPSSIPQLDYIRVGKSETNKLIRSRK